MLKRIAKARAYLAGRKRSLNAKRDMRLGKQLAALAKLPDSAIDTSDIPEVMDWSGAQVGRFRRSSKRRRNRP